MKSGKLVLPVVVVTLTILAAIYVAIQLRADPNEKYAEPGVHAYVKQVDNPAKLKVKIVNNTPYPIRPIRDESASNWALFKITSEGWQLFNYELSICDVYGIDEQGDVVVRQPIEPDGVQEYYINSLLHCRGGHALTPQISEPALIDIESGGLYILEIVYVIEMSEGDATRVTYTNPFKYDPDDVGDEMSITLQSRLRGPENGGTVEFTITNETERDIWVRPLGLEIRSSYDFMGPEYPDILLMRRVDETSWEYMGDWPILNHSKQPVVVGAGATRRLQGVDMDTEFSIKEPGLYRIRLPIYLDYTTDLEELFLDSRRYIFSEEFEVR